MPRANQPDLFATDTQPDLFGAESATPVYRPDPDKVRSRLHKILAEARAAQKLPWEPTKVSLYRTIFPQMTNWLPEDSRVERDRTQNRCPLLLIALLEAAQLRFEFETELERLEAA